jgi:hypothetical protein
VVRTFSLDYFIYDFNNYILLDGKVSDECLYKSECDLINCVKKYREEYKEYEGGGDDEGNGRLSSARELAGTIYGCRKLIYRGETSPMVNETYFMIHSQNTLDNFLYWNKKDQYNIEKINEIIKKISENDKFSKNKNNKNKNEL